ncbi:flavin reductase family protein [Fulvivirgaceae bacterium PWU4]|uniref:Flavin reductase family protein n=1 Tax=Chryseosolibacter histidini TaxID=2782349 RepID=A0AAP2GSP3_9BACT|nr:flavin reductase family protein [Chryseosolibacter histidini]MBT1700837.1 flavin reductase family protein [Chryseosolibacter histidini]
MLTLNPKEIPVAKMHSYLLGAVTPRPIAFASTVDKAGNVNLSPFSFFNCFGANPPILIFSPARRGRDNTTKHTYENLREVPEVVINVVTYNMVQQTSLASTEYPKGVNEFIKAGFTAAPSVVVTPPRVSESPISMECKVLQIIQTGDQGAAGNLVICEVLRMHINEQVLDAEGKIDPWKLDAVARLGADYYCRVQGDSIFKVPKPLDKMGIGIDSLPENIRRSKILTGNDLGLLGNVERLPDQASIDEFSNRYEVKAALQHGEVALHQLAHQYLKDENVNDAWKVLLAGR